MLSKSKKVPKKEQVSESTKIHKFIDDVMSKNYSSANKYLKSVILDKIQEKIQKEINKPLF